MVILLLQPSQCRNEPLCSAVLAYLLYWGGLFLYYILFFWDRSLSTALTDLELVILLSQPIDCWNCRCVGLRQAYITVSCSLYLLIWHYKGLRIIIKFINFLKIFNCVCVISVGTCRGIRPPEPGLQEVGCHLKQVLTTEFRSSARVVHVPNHWAISPALIHNHIVISISHILAYLSEH